MTITPDQVLYWGPRIACGLVFLSVVNTIRKHCWNCRRFGSLDV